VWDIRKSARFAVSPFRLAAKTRRSTFPTFGGAGPQAAESARKSSLGEAGGGGEADGGGWLRSSWMGAYALKPRTSALMAVRAAQYNKGRR
jgi:hypothetical protein